MNARRARHLRQALHREFDFLARHHHQVGHLVDDDDDVGHRAVVDVLALIDGAARLLVEAGLYGARERLAGAP